MRRLALQRIASIVTLLSPLRALAAELLNYDPAANKDARIAAPDGIVELTVDPLTPLLTIPSGFYGLNVHPGSAKYEFAHVDLLRALKPDAIRIMTLMRSDWPPEGTGRIVTPLSPRQGIYNWQELDRMLETIVSIGAEPYLALGFGPPDWISGASSPTVRRPPLKDKLDDYADFMATIVHRYAVEKGWPIRRVTIDNEPENVGYSIGTYIDLARKAIKEIHARAPRVKIGGPATGFARWPQPDGTTLGFSESTRRLKDASVPFDFIDWHIYAVSAETVLSTVKSVRDVYGSSIPLVISELNRDWRYSSETRRISQKNNTDWDSVAWLAYIYDRLQVLGLSQVFYFNWREDSLGLTHTRTSELRPNYYLFWTLTNLLGRARVKTTSSTQAVGCIATFDSNQLSSLIYNRSGKDIAVGVSLVNGPRTFDTYKVGRDWVDQTKHRLQGDQLLPQPSRATLGTAETVVVPAGGYVLLKQV